MKNISIIKSVTIKHFPQETCCLSSQLLACFASVQFFASLPLLFHDVLLPRLDLQP